MLALMFCLSLPYVYAQQLQLEVIPLKHRTTDEVIEVIRPLITAPSGTVSGMNNQLIIRTTAQNLAEIKQVLDTIDNAPRRLLITVRQNSTLNGSDSSRSLSGSASSGDVTISSRSSRPQRRGVVVEAGDEDGNIRYSAVDSVTDRRDDNSFSVQTVDGQAAFIQAGQAVPVSSRDTFITGSGVVSRDTVEFRDVTSGFYVLPRVNGDRVTLRVSPQQQQLSPGKIQSFDVQNVETTIQGRLGEWLDIGGLDRSGQDHNRSTLDTQRSRQTEQRSIQLKVEEIR